MNRITGLAGLAALLATFVSSAHAANIFIQPRSQGGSYLYIVGDIVAGDEQRFAAFNPPPPVYVRPISLGGNPYVGMAIADMVWQRQYSTLSINKDVPYGGCASACTTIWLAGYHVIAEGNALLRFHSCFNAVTNQDDLQCDVDVAKGLMKYGYTQFQALHLADASPHEKPIAGTAAWAASMGFPIQYIAAFPGAEGNCTARWCIALPHQPTYPVRPTYPAYPVPPRPFVRPMYPYRPFVARPFVRPVYPFAQPFIARPFARSMPFVRRR